jgi:Flp pilus assembly protein TadD
VTSLLRLFREGNPIAVGILLAVAIGGAYLPVVQNDFINYDDPSFIFSNSHVRTGLSWGNVRWAFTTLEKGFWHPLTWLSLMLDCQVFGLRAGGHHATSLLLHIASAVLLFLVFRRLTGATWRSAIVAALFGLHPLHVESVAWAAERKDVLSTFFLMLTLWAYVRYAQVRCAPATAELKRGKQGEDRGGEPAAVLPAPAAFYLLALVFFTLGLMSKTMLVTVPLVLLLLDFWPLERLSLPAFWRSPTAPRRLLLEKLPFLILAFGFGLVTVFAQRGAGALQDSVTFPVFARVQNALCSYVHYLLQTVWPSHLAVYYPYPRGFATGAVLVAASLLAGLTAAVVWCAWRRRYPAFGWIWYLLTLLPVIGLVQVGNQSHADRYTYVPLIGIFVVVTWGACELAGNRRLARLVLPTAAVAVLALCLVLTRRQVGYWRDSETLFRHALAVTQDNEVAHNNLGTALMRRRQPEEAITHFKEAVTLAPQYALAYGNLGAALFGLGRMDESIRYSAEAVRLRPGFAGAHRNLGAALGSKGRLDEAIPHLHEAVRLEPTDPQGHFNLGCALLSKGHIDDAILHFHEALRLQPNSPEAAAGLRAASAANDRLLRTKASTNSPP